MRKEISVIRHKLNSAILHMHHTLQPLQPHCGPRDTAICITSYQQTETNNGKERHMLILYAMLITNSAAHPWSHLVSCQIFIIVVMYVRAFCAIIFSTSLFRP